MIVFVTLAEGGKWHQLDVKEFYHIQKQNKLKFAAVKLGKYIYDFNLKSLGYNPIRLYREIDL